MFGYIIFNKPELKFREFEEYRSCYCGICRQLKRSFGARGQLALNYDITFLFLLLTGLYEPACKSEKIRCILHPLRKRTVLNNEFSGYCADMGLFLVYYKCIDDWKDEKKLLKYLYARIVKRRIRGIEEKYPKKCSDIEKYLNMLSEYEAGGSDNIDEVAGCFGNIMAVLFAYKDDIWADCLGELGFYLGKYIYLADAYDDIADDIKKGSYNILRNIYDRALAEHADRGDAMLYFSKECRKLMTMMITAGAKQFEKLPVIVYAGILRNILYSGVWCRFNQTTAKLLKSCKREET